MNNTHNDNTDGDDSDDNENLTSARNQQRDSSREVQQQ